MAYNYSSPESFVSSFNAAPTTKPWMVSDPNNPGGQMRDPGATGTPQATQNTDPTTGMVTTGIMNPFGLVWNGSQNAGFVPGANYQNNASAPSWLGGGQQQTPPPTPPPTTNTAPPPPPGNDPNTVAGGQGGYTGNIGGQNFVNGVPTDGGPGTAPPPDPNSDPGFGTPELSRSPAANPGAATTDAGGRRLSAFQSFPQQPPQDFGNQQNQQQANQPGSMDLSGMGQNFPPAFMNMLQQLLGSMGGQQQQPGMGMGSSGGPNSPGNYYGEAPQPQNPGQDQGSYFAMLPQIQQLLQGLMGGQGQQGAYQGQRQEQYGRNFA